MPRLANRLPAYRFHKSSGQAVVTLSGRTFYLGKFNSPASRAEYDRLCSEWVATRRMAPPEPPTAELTVSMLIEQFLIWAHGKYRKRTGRTLPDGSPERVPTSEISNLKSPLRLLRRLYGHTQVKAFSAKALVNIREEMIRLGWCRSNINRQIDRVRRVFSWGCGAPGLVPPALVVSLREVDALSSESSDVRESDPVRPVDAEHVRAIKPFVSNEVGAMMELQLLTGMRPGEVVIMRGCDLDTTKAEWIYTPSSHKTQHRGKSRFVPLGPRAQTVLEPFLSPDVSAYLFSPSAAERRRRAARTAERVTPEGVGNGVGDNRVKRPARTAGDRYTTGSYGRAIRRGCELAFPAPRARLSSNWRAKSPSAIG